MAGSFMAKVPVFNVNSALFVFVSALVSILISLGVQNDASLTLHFTIYDLAFP